MMRPPVKSLPPVILIGASVRAAVDSVRLAGGQAVAIDQFGDVDTRKQASKWFQLDPEDPSESLRTAVALLRSEGVETPIPVIPTGGLESWTKIPDDLPATTFCGPTADVIARLRQWPFVEQLAARVGWHFPPTAYVADAIKGGFVLKKQAKSSAGLAVQKLMPPHPTSRNQVNSPVCHTSAPTRGSCDGHYFQQPVAGRPLGASLIVGEASARLVGCCRAVHWSCDLRPYLYAGAIGPYSLPVTVRQQLELLGQILAGEHGYRGLLGVDLILPRGSQSPWLLELNPRYTGSMEILERLGNHSLILEHLQAWGWSTQPEPIRPSNSYPSTRKLIKWILWSRHAWTFRADTLQRAIVELGLAETTPAWADIPSEGCFIPAEAPIITLIIESDEPFTVLRRLKLLQRRLESYRD